MMDSSENPSEHDFVQQPQHVNAIQELMRENVLLQLLDTTELLEVLEHNLRGEKKNLRTGEWEMRVIGYRTDSQGRVIVDDQGRPLYPVHAPLMNEIGISRIMGVMESLVNHVSQSTNLNIDDVMRCAEEGGLWIIEQLYLNHTAWGVRKEDFGSIVLLIDQTNYKVLRQAFGDGTRNMITKTHTINEIIQSQQQQKKPFKLFG